jgi:ubiquinone biosynthesis accessory factor UbiK
MEPALAFTETTRRFLRHRKAPNAMLNPKLLDEMSARVSSLLAATPAGDIEKNLRAALAGVFAKLDLVTREEFDVQREVLSRTRAKLEALEASIAELEARGRKPPPEPTLK